MMKNTIPTAPRIISNSSPLLISKIRNASQVDYETVEDIDQTTVFVKLRFYISPTLFLSKYNQHLPPLCWDLSRISTDIKITQ